MSDQNKNENVSRFDKLTKSVIESDHPIFSKVRRELPSWSQRQVHRDGILPVLKKLVTNYRLFPKAIALVLAFVLSFFIYRDISKPFLDYQLGEPAPRPLVAPKTMDLVDEETTEARRQLALANLRSVYDFDW